MKYSLFDSFQMISLARLTRFVRFESGGHDAVGIEGSVVTFIFFSLMEVPVLIKVVAGAQRPRTQDGLGASEAPAGACNFHAVFDQMAARAFNDSGGDGKSSSKVMIILEVWRIGEQVVRAGIHGFAIFRSKASQRGATAHAPAT